MSQLSPLHPTSLKALGPSEELVATVPDLQFGVVANGIAELNYTVPFNTNSRKRNRTDSGCSLSDFEISGDEDFSFIDLKRPCSGAISSSPYALPIAYPAKEFNIELDSVFQFGPGTDQQTPVTNIHISNQYTCQKPSEYPQQSKTRCLDQVFTGMQPAELPSNPYKHDLMLNCDQDCKLVITEHPEEVIF